MRVTRGQGQVTKGYLDDCINLLWLLEQITVNLAA